MGLGAATYTHVTRASQTGDSGHGICNGQAFHDRANVGRTMARTHALSRAGRAVPGPMSCLRSPPSLSTLSLAVTP